MKRRSRPTQLTAAKRRKTMVKDARNWLDLPRDVTIMIFMKLGVVELLMNAQRVCTLWRRVAEEPSLYDSLDFAGAKNYINNDTHFLRFVAQAVHRGRGQLVSLSFHDFTIRDVLHYIYISNLFESLKSFHLGSAVFISGCQIAQVCKHVPSLEELDIDFFNFPKNAIQAIGRTCKKLTSFRLIKHYTSTSFEEEAFAIVHNMPRLCRLTLSMSLLTNEGLETLLDGLPNLEYLDLRNCSSSHVGKGMLNKCASRVKNVWLPDKSACAEVDFYVKYQSWYIERKESGLLA